MQKLAEKYENNEEFKKFENAVAYNVYYEKPVSKLPQDIQNRINNLPIEAKQIIMSTYVQYGEGSKIIKNNFTKSIDDYDVLERIINIKQIDGYVNRYNTEIDLLDKIYNNIKEN